MTFGVFHTLEAPFHKKNHIFSFFCNNACVFKELILPCVKCQTLIFKPYEKDILHFAYRWCYGGV